MTLSGDQRQKESDRKQQKLKLSFNWICTCSCYLSMHCLPRPPLLHCSWTELCAYYRDCWVGGGPNQEINLCGVAFAQCFVLITQSHLIAGSTATLHCIAFPGNDVVIKEGENLIMTSLSPRHNNNVSMEETSHPKAHNTHNVIQ